MTTSPKNKGTSASKTQTRPTNAEGTASSPKPFTFADLLHGIQAGRMQSVGLMQVIPLLSDLEDQRFVSPKNALISTQGYGTFVFENLSSKLLLVPCQAGVVVKEAAQDHAMPTLAVVKPKETKAFVNAMCIQRQQPGLIAPGSYKIIILPYALREEALSRRNEGGFSKLWGAIQHFNERGGLGQDGSLSTFLTHYKQQLDHFVAEFEPLPRQVGAVILIGGEIYGIERAPSQAYFREIWSSLIRECYGSEAIERAKIDPTAALATRVSLRTDALHTLDDLVEALREADAKEEALARSLLQDLLGQTIDVKLEESIASPKGAAEAEAESKSEGFLHSLGSRLKQAFNVAEEDKELERLTVFLAESRDFQGQILHDGQAIPYASMILSKAGKRQRAWEKAPAFSFTPSASDEDGDVLGGVAPPTPDKGLETP